MARIAILFVCWAALAHPLAARAETPLKSWERIERIRQGQGAAAAIPLAREVLAGQPEFPPLFSQYARLRTSLDGFAGARALRDSLRARGSLRQARWAEVFLAREEGRFQAALDTLAILPPAPAGSVEEIFHQLDLTVLQVSARHPSAADSLLALLGDSSRKLAGAELARTFVQLTTEELRVARQLQSGRYDDELSRLDDLARRAESQNFLDLSMRMQHLRARTLTSLSRYEQALNAYDAELELARRLRDRWQLAAASAWKAFALERLERYGPALELRRLCLAEFPQLGDTLGTSYSMLSMGWDAMRVGETGAAEAVLEQALQAGQSRHWEWMEAQACINLGVLFMETGRFERSMQVLERARSLSREGHDSYRRTWALNNIAILHLMQGRPDRAMEIYEKLLSIHRGNKDFYNQIAVLNNMALASEQMGQTAQARVMYERSLELAKEQGLADNIARINLGRNTSASGDYVESERILRDAITDASQRQDAHQLAAAHAELGSCLSSQGKWEEAQRHLLLADRLRNDAGIVSERVPGLLELARVELARERWPEGLDALDRAQPLIMSYAHGFEATLHALRARAFLGEGEADSARVQARQALAVAASSLAGEDAEFRSGRQRAAGTALRVLLQSAGRSGERATRDLTKETFQLLQRVQSHSLLEYVQGGQRPIEPDVPDSLLEQERAARVTVDRLQREIGTGLNLDASPDSLRLALAEAQARQERLRTLVFRLDRRYRNLTQPAELDSSELERILAPGTLVLDYLCGHGCESGDDCSVLLFAADSLGVRVYPVGRTPQVARQIDLLADLLESPPHSGDDETIRLMLRELGGVLLGPVADRIHRYESVIVVPDGVLTRVPFAALRIPIARDPSNTSYVLEQTTLQTVPSLAVLAQLRRAQGHARGTRPRWDIAIWRGSSSEGSRTDARTGTHLALPHADDELRRLRRGFARTAVFSLDSAQLGEDQNEFAGSGPSNASKVLHFIAHGYFDSRQPWRSGLYFTSEPDSQGSNKLEIADIYRMKLQCSLVTLSACETARGDFDEGVGFLGLTQALFGSGVPSVLATLWPIDDASAPSFVTDFYRHLAQGSSKAEALRQAQLQFLRDDELRQPFYWAPYLLVGDGSGRVALTVRHSISLATPKVTLAIALLLLLGALWAWRRKAPA